MNKSLEAFQATQEESRARMMLRTASTRLKGLSPLIEVTMHFMCTHKADLG
jgi:hypothetical protein